MSTEKTSHKLFDDSSDESADAKEEELEAAKVLNVGNNYAQRYNDWRRKEELSKLKQKYGDNLDVPSEIEGSDDDGSGDDSEGDEEDDEEDSDVSSESLHDDAFDEQFFKVFSALKNKAPEIYDKSFAVAAPNDDPAVLGEGGSKSPLKKMEKQTKKFTLQDYHQKLIKEKKGITEEDEQMLNENDDEEEEKPSGYYEELHNIRQEIRDIAKKAGNDGENDDDEGDDDDQFFSIKDAPKSQKASDLVQKAENVAQKEKLISQIWSKSSTKKGDSGDDFLKDYILNKRYIDPTLSTSVVKRFKEPESHFGGFDKAAENGDNNHHEDDSSSEEEDEKEGQKSANVPNIAKYHYEEPDATVIKRYPRAIDSIRETINEKEKKSHRAEVRERKKAEKQVELRRLRKLKREEIEAKIDKLKKISGNTCFDVKDLDLNVIIDDESEFDMAKYDEKMNLLFGDSYYDTNADDSKPSFEYVPEIDDDLYGDDEKPNKKKKKSKKDIKKQHDIMADDDIGLYEDIIGGEVATRFRYRVVEPNDFGLTDEEILRADDRELNKWCSLKKMSQYRTSADEARDKRAYAQRKSNLELKRKILKSLYEKKKEGDEADGEDDDGGELKEASEEGVNSVAKAGDGAEQANKKKRGKKRRKKTKIANFSVTSADGNVDQETSDKPGDELLPPQSPVKKAVKLENKSQTNGNNKTIQSRKRKRNQSKQQQPNKKGRRMNGSAAGPGSTVTPGTDVTLQRLKAYGMSNRDIRKMNSKKG